MNSMLLHRGPDSDNTYLDDRIALGATRLSIMDVENGSQPYFNEEHNIVAVFNGEIYNDTALRDMLAAAGHVLHTTCDGELIPHLYEEFGLEFCRKIDGMFAIALWDQSAQKLLITGDSIGIKPLYYTSFQDGHLGFASELKALRAAVTEPFALDPVSMVEYLKFKSIPAPFTPYQGVYKLRPGETIVWQDGKKEHHFLTPDEQPATDLRTALAENVRTTMRSDVPVGCIVSGGLDSSFVLSAMAEAESEPVDAYSVGYPGELEDDETIYAERITEEVGGRFTRVTSEPQEIPDLLKKVVWHLEEPNQDPITIPFYSLMKRVRDDYAVVLTGDGSDELFGGYARYRLWDQEDSTLALAHYVEELQVFTDDELAGFLQPEHLAHLDVHREASDSLQQVASLRDAMAWELRYRLPSYHLFRVDKLSMAWGVEARVPFLRNGVAALSKELDGQDLRREGMEKYALRQAVTSYLPDWLLERKKKPFTFPIVEWLRTELYEWAHDLLMHPEAKIRTMLRTDRVRRLLEEHRAGQADHSHKIWSLLVLETFLRQVH